MASGSRIPVSGSARTNFPDDVPVRDWRTNVFPEDDAIPDKKHALVPKDGNIVLSSPDYLGLWWSSTNTSLIS